MTAAWLALLAGCGATSDAPSASNDREQRILTEARVGILMMLRDPGSAQFGHLYVNDQGIVCGTVNARNGFGGYTGHRAFYWLPRRYDGLIAEGGQRIVVEARMFEEKGCSIGPDHERALETARIEDQLRNGVDLDDIVPADEAVENIADSHDRSGKSGERM